MKTFYIETPLVKKARLMANDAHRYSKPYGGLPYIVHLALTAQVGYKFHNLLDFLSFNEKDGVMASLWLHDTNEDCSWTYNETKKDFGFHVAETVYYVSDHKGKNRAERQHLTYKEMSGRTPSIFVKICDRIANFTWSLQTGGGEMYLKEDSHFQQLRTGESAKILAPLWDAYDELIFYAQDTLKVHQNVSYSSNVDIKISRLDGTQCFEVISDKGKNFMSENFPEIQFVGGKAKVHFKHIVQDLIDALKDTDLLYSE